MMFCASNGLGLDNGCSCVALGTQDKDSEGMNPILDMLSLRNCGKVWGGLGEMGPVVGRIMPLVPQKMPMLQSLGLGNVTLRDNRDLADAIKRRTFRRERVPVAQCNNQGTRLEDGGRSRIRAREGGVRMEADGL